MEKETLIAIPLFSELSIEQLRNISAISKVKKFRKGEILFRTGENYLGFYILLKGIIKVYDLTKDGKENVIHIVKPVNIFADIPLFEGRDYPVTAEALSESLAMLVPRKAFIELLKKHPEISLKMLGGFAKRMKALVVQIEDLSSKEVINRLAKYLLKEIKKSGTEKLPEPFIKLTVPKFVIASYLGTITETLSRTFKKLQEEKTIRTHGKSVFVIDLPKLKKLASGNSN